MAKDWIDVDKIKVDLDNFFSTSSADLSKFGSTVNQTFEAFVFVSVAKWYIARGWTVEPIHPTKVGSASRDLHLKFRTRGKPSAYTYFRCTKRNAEVHVRHQLRVATKYHQAANDPPANICLDVAVVMPVDLSDFSSDDFLENSLLLTFGEAKHMSAFAELIASFIGLVHELSPQALKRHKTRFTGTRRKAHPAPFLYVSGFLYRTAAGMKLTIENRGYDIDIYDRVESLISTSELPSKTPAT
jgi:hypothetical protein